jgi:hypothetical protein
MQNNRLLENLPWFQDDTPGRRRRHVLVDDELAEDLREVRERLLRVVVQRRLGRLGPVGEEGGHGSGDGLPVEHLALEIPLRQEHRGHSVPG